MSLEERLCVGGQGPGAPGTESTESSMDELRCPTPRPPGPSGLRPLGEDPRAIRAPAPLPVGLCQPEDPRVTSSLLCRVWF